MKCREKREGNNNLKVNKVYCLERFVACWQAHFPPRHKLRNWWIYVRTRDKLVVLYTQASQKRSQIGLKGGGTLLLATTHQLNERGGLVYVSTWNESSRGLQTFLQYRRTIQFLILLSISLHFWTFMCVIWLERKRKERSRTWSSWLITSQSFLLSSQSLTWFQFR